MLSFQAACFQKSETGTPAGQLIPWRLSRGREFPSQTRTKADSLGKVGEVGTVSGSSGQQRLHTGAASPLPRQGGLGPLHMLGEDQVPWGVEAKVGPSG